MECTMGARWKHVECGCFVTTASAGGPLRRDLLGAFSYAVAHGEPIRNEKIGRLLWNENVRAIVRGNWASTARILNCRGTAG